MKCIKEHRMRLCEREDVKAKRMRERERKATGKGKNEIKKKCGRTSALNVCEDVRQK